MSARCTHVCTFCPLIDNANQYDELPLYEATISILRDSLTSFIYRKEGSIALDRSMDGKFVSVRCTRAHLGRESLLSSPPLSHPPSQPDVCECECMSQPAPAQKRTRTDGF